MWMSDDLEYMDFSRDSFNIRDICDLFFFKYFYGYLLACEDVPTLLDLSESALSYVLA